MSKKKIPVVSFNLSTWVTTTFKFLKLFQSKRLFNRFHLKCMVNIFKLFKIVVILLVTQIDHMSNH